MRNTLKLNVSAALNTARSYSRIHVALKRFLGSLRVLLNKTVNCVRGKEKEIPTWISAKNFRVLRELELNISSKQEVFFAQN